MQNYRLQHQTQLYNDQCPEDPEGYNGHVKSGCVANAMAQIMRYWEWPKTGVGSHSYYCYGYGSTSYGTLTANFGGGGHGTLMEFRQGLQRRWTTGLRGLLQRF